MAPILVLPELLAEMGFDPARLIAEARLDSALFDDPDNTISFVDLGRLLALCATRTGCPHLGLLIGERGSLDVLGAVGRLARFACDLGGALRDIILYLHVHDRGAVPALWVGGDRAMLAYVVYQPDIAGTEQIYDAAVAIAYIILKTLAGPDWEAQEVRLCRPLPVEIDPYRRFFRARLRFGAEHNAVVFPASWLDHSLEGADAWGHWEILHEIQNLEVGGAGDLVARLQRVLRRLLVGGAGHGETSLEQIAKLFAVHPRTLNRRLHARGTSFKALIDAARYDIARQLLRDTRLPVVEIAAALDYSESAAFVRAFHRWSGTSPAAWRAANKRI